MRVILGTILLTATVCGATMNVAVAHPQFKKALTAKYEFKEMGGVSCYTCHRKGRDPATNKLFSKEVRNEFGKLFVPHLKGKNIDARAAESKALKDEIGDTSERSKKDEIQKKKDPIDAGLTKDFLEALEKVEAMKDAETGKTYAELLKAAEIYGVKYP